jgi:LysR family glycine cleavage system transcriptional activator
VPVPRAPSPLALRAFEVAARRLSFTEAARELHVTQAAVSRHIHALETNLGHPLFHRLHQRVELTKAGKELADELAASFARIDNAIEMARGSAVQRLRLTVEPAFASGFLVPRLGAFSAAFPEIEIELDASEELRSLGRDADVAIRYLGPGARRPPKLGLHLLATDAIPVTKAVLPHPPDWSSDAAVLGVTLLHDGDGEDWRRWLRAAQLHVSDKARHQYFSDYSLALSAARLGQGAALAMTVFVERELRDGVLSQLGQTRVSFGDYWLFQARNHATKIMRSAFSRWLRAEFLLALADGAMHFRESSTL